MRAQVPTAQKNCSTIVQHDNRTSDFGFGENVLDDGSENAKTIKQPQSMRRGMAQSMPSIFNAQDGHHASKETRNRVGTRITMVAPGDSKHMLSSMKTRMPLGMEETLTTRQRVHMQLYAPLTDKQNLQMCDVRRLLERRLEVPAHLQSSWYVQCLKISSLKISVALMG